MFRLNGNNYHSIGSLIPPYALRPTFSQLYIYDTKNEVSNRISSFEKKVGATRADPDNVKGLQMILNENNSRVKSFRTARDKFDDGTVREFNIWIINSRSSDGRIYNTPSSSEVAGIIVWDLSLSNCERDVIVHHQVRGLQRISDLHPSLMAMQYPLLFTYGEDGRHVGIENRQSKITKPDGQNKLTMREYYSFKLRVCFLHFMACNKNIVYSTHKKKKKK